MMRILVILVVWRAKSGALLPCVTVLEIPKYLSTRTGKRLRHLATRMKLFTYTLMRSRRFQNFPTRFSL
jgi:hypothetical protein